MKHLLFWGMAFAAFHMSYSIEEFCNLPADEGTGQQYVPFLHYNKDTDKCTPFFYKGEGGNLNRFRNERDCIRNCSINANALYPTDETLACHFKHEKGGCGNNFLRYYYDSQHNKCKKFLWTGCFGNGNRFFDHDSCNATCAGIHDIGTDAEEDEPDTPIAIICGVLLAAIVCAIFITVIVLTVKSKNKKKLQEKSKNPKTETPLQEQAIEMN